MNLQITKISVAMRVNNKLGTAVKAYADIQC